VQYVISVTDESFSFVTSAARLSCALVMSNDSKQVDRAKLKKPVHTIGSSIPLGPRFRG